MIKFWPTQNGNFLSNNKGLTLDYIAFFKQLKLGDQLIIFVNDDGTLTLKKSTLKKEHENE